jgi:hypothetical protein
LSDCQARSKAKLDFHFNASLSAVTFAKLEARQQNSNCDQAFSMASLKRRAFNQHLIDRIWGIHAKRDKLSSIAYCEELISFAMSATLQNTDRRHGIVGQERCHFQRDS